MVAKVLEVAGIHSKYRSNNLKVDRTGKINHLVKSLSECILSGVVFLDDLDVILIHADL